MQASSILGLVLAFPRAAIANVAAHRPEIVMRFGLIVISGIIPSPVSLPQVAMVDINERGRRGIVVPVGMPWDRAVGRDCTRPGTARRQQRQSNQPDL